MKKTYYRVRHTQLGSDGGQWKYFRTAEEAEAFEYGHVAAGGGAGNVHKATFDTEKDCDDIDMIESILYAEKRGKAALMRSFPFGSTSTNNFQSTAAVLGADHGEPPYARPDK